MTIRILLVDDNTTFLAAVRNFFNAVPGVEVIGSALSGNEALVAAQCSVPDLILLDIDLPDMGGLEVARRITRWPNAPHIVFLSMHDNSGYREAAALLGVDGFVSKAEFVRDLLPMVERLVAVETPSGGAC